MSTAVELGVPDVDPAVATQILPPDADRDRGKWLLTRRTGIGGSDVSAVVGLSRYSSPMEVWEDKTGRVPLLDTESEAARWGRLLEAVVRDETARQLRLTVRKPGTYRSARWPWMIASPDGLCSDGGGYEGKTGGVFTAHEWAEGQVPDHAELQAQWGMAVFDLGHWWVAGLIGGQKLELRRVDRDVELIAELVERTGRFWREHVEADTPPPVDGSKALSDYLAERYPASMPDNVAEIAPDVAEELLADYRLAKDAEADAEAALREVQNRAKDLMRGAEQLAVGELVIATWRTSAKFAEARFRKQHPELVAEFTRRVEVDQLDTAALAAAHPQTYREFCSRPLTFKC